MNAANGCSVIFTISAARLDSGCPYKLSHNIVLAIWLFQVFSKSCPGLSGFAGKNMVQKVHSPCFCAQEGMPPLGSCLPPYDLFIKITANIHLANRTFHHSESHLFLTSFHPIITLVAFLWLQYEDT